MGGDTQEEEGVHGLPNSFSLLSVWWVFLPAFSPHNVSPPCGVMKDCSNQKDGKYADMDQHCHSYYTCFDGKFLGHNPCPSSEYSKGLESAVLQIYFLFFSNSQGLKYLKNHNLLLRLWCITNLQFNNRNSQLKWKLRKL